MDKEKKFYKRNENDIIFWIETPDRLGEHLFTFDKTRIFNLFADYPWKLTKKEKAIFDKENPEWVEFFKDRK